MADLIPIEEERRSEAAARAAYEEYNSGLIGCCEPAWEELPVEHRERLIRATWAAIQEYMP